jgi:division protein CdvB (Snf7/Vps24/ESCRT-III family)
MMQAMKGATMALGSMNKTMNLPSLQRIAMEFERENDIMEQRQEMMDDAIDDAMDVGLEEEGDEVVERVLEEIGVDLSQAVRQPHPALHVHLADIVCRWAKRQPVSKPMPSQKARSPKQLAEVVVVVAEVRLPTMIFRHAWIACDDKPKPRIW